MGLNGVLIESVGNGSPFSILDLQDIQGHAPFNISVDVAPSAA